MLAAKTDVELRLFRSFESPASVYLLPDLANLGQEILSDHILEQRLLAYLESKRGEFEGHSCDLQVDCGDPAGQILAASDLADLIVMSSHGRSSRGRWLGGVTTKVVRASHKPVLVVAGPKENDFKIDNIMVCLDGTPLAETALLKAVELARAAGAKLTLYRFVPLVYDGMDMEAQMGIAKDYLQEVERAHPDLVSATLVRWTNGGSDIVQCAQELGTDLIVMGSHGSRGVVRLLLGSVAEDALHRADCPVMIVR
jgi:nucleotide-binding universal stress UspA family protein